MNELANIIESVNQLVDVEGLLRLINYHVGTIQIKGAKLRCFCPVHNNEIREMSVAQKTKRNSTSFRIPSMSGRETVAHPVRLRCQNWISWCNCSFSCSVTTDIRDP
jgi:hypothetical protein